ncbi:YihY/virulence factor BrkB family protein [Rhodococcus rhodnii]|uniref:Uncharacterized protein n=2 Tax=Rhodococcus rhodnii TaxID=38312 RepID=R7WQ32_9NOCA|nr:hypothetical protein Rrhod_1318 [Rhodococcus rhodnii LMG 5362]TXG91734.1 YihY/virulence factor BrkB family protein [Rhodococcus rhodnii]
MRATAAVLVRTVRRAIDVRVTGLAAEMAYYALISLIPLATAVGAALGSLERIIGTEEVDRIEGAVVDGLSTVFQEQITSDVLAPLVRGLLREERTGIAIGSVAVALWLASRVFRAAIRTLDAAYGAPERRGIVAQGVLGLGFAAAAVVTLVILVGTLVVGPLLGGGRVVAEALGLTNGFQAVWDVGRWPVVFLVVVAFLVVLYRFAPNVDHTWRDCVPAACAGAALVVAVAFAFGLYLRMSTPVSAAAAPDTPDQAVLAAAQVVGTLLSAVLWLWLTSIAVLSAGVLGAEIEAYRGRSAAGGDQPGDDADVDDHADEFDEGLRDDDERDEGEFGGQGQRERQDDERVACRGAEDEGPPARSVQSRRAGEHAAERRHDHEERHGEGNHRDE